MKGIEALQRLRADPATRAIPVIAVTASDDAGPPPDHSRRFDGYQPKPISVKSLLQAIREMLPSR